MLLTRNNRIKEKINDDHQLKEREIGNFDILPAISLIKSMLLLDIHIGPYKKLSHNYYAKDLRTIFCGESFSSMHKAEVQLQL